MAFRKRIWPGKEIQEHNGLSKWFQAIDQDSDLNGALAPVFAKMFLEDADLLPHGFLPTELFASIYGPLCRQAWHHAVRDCDWITHKGLGSFLDAVVSRMGHQVPDLWHNAQLGLQKVRGKPLCCMCPWNMQPWAVFPCGHGICERDAWRYSGIQPNDAEHPTLSHFKACPACHAPVDLKLRLRPLQAGYRVATFDGGGVLGIVSLIALRTITEGLPRALSAHHFFDLIVGTSTVKTKQDVVRVAITSATFDSRLCLFRSYGDVLREAERGNYKPESLFDLPLWQAIATSCAAPLVFEPVNGLQDGAFAANCPAWVAMMEVNELSMLGSRLLDFSVSFGTGQFLSPDRSRSRSWLKHLVPEWVSRLGCGLGSVVDADSMYGKFSSALNRAERDGKHYRVEPSFRTVPIALDDPAFLTDLTTETELYMKSPNVQQSTLHLQLAMLASCFYAALLSPPAFDSNVGQYCARLAVLSRWPEDGDIRQSLGEKLEHASFIVGTLARPYTIPLYCTIYRGPAVSDAADIPATSAMLVSLGYTQAGRLPFGRWLQQTSLYCPTCKWLTRNGFGTDYLVTGCPAMKD
ncbi:hypothetical protein N7508_011137 [Penicillium antarcticum]|uniref:uncharacterized protein n=1 Tax=Penicillium antarcticum TaxID=416450 RepID=UPI002391FC12|nr:uncharacterized protein N7508_011137 [Penicillium antarcticum]KAJ5288362.1 hypothetical protein N7508_011137 [Penicillium antarcticum]